MDKSTQPSKEAVRNWLQSRQEERRPLPDPQQIRRELGWEMVRVEQDQRTWRLAD
ncbi:hypothetical protein SAMN05518865_106186 [Duganella sp. CF458]|uniref:hypothetical protein n=1 Tax=Duganella sp. CF458 TaxID=1884368 RepID=UPI0008F26191|nr:hypothetical protein [Duganella sp. CF458]SFF94108.1 hypothetical protein SAMN05518865_106186 [Duganella sp. CF458]